MVLNEKKAREFLTFHGEDLRMAVSSSESKQLISNAVANLASFTDRQLLILLHRVYVLAPPKSYAQHMVQIYASLPHHPSDFPRLKELVPPQIKQHVSDRTRALMKAIPLGIALALGGILLGLVVDFGARGIHIVFVPPAILIAGGFGVILAAALIIDATRKYHRVQQDLVLIRPLGGEWVAYMADWPTYYKIWPSMDIAIEYARKEFPQRGISLIEEN